jgi:hypothetical protein
MSRVAMVVADADGRAAVWPKIGVDDPYTTKTHSVTSTNKLAAMHRATSSQQRGSLRYST